MSPWLTAQITRRVEETDSIARFELKSVDETPLPAFTAGAHIDVVVTEDLTRQYSLCNDPADTGRYEIAVLNEPDSRGGSKQIHATFKAGDTVTISAPRNHFELNDTGDKVLLLAGGIGVTPLLSMAEVLAKGETPFEFHYCGRAPETMAFDARLKTAAFKDAVTLHYDSGPAEQRLDLDALFKSSGDGFQVYVCGPAGFIDWVLTSAADFGVPDDKVHTEYFMATNDPLNAEDNQSFEVVIASTGNSYVIPPDRSIVEVLEENGIEIIVSCQQGICGSCVTTILEGEPIHNDQVLTDEEKDEDHQFTPCCSRAASKTLVLDL